MTDTDAQAVVLDDVSAGYGRGDVLKRVSLAFRRGETFVLLGPNGAGKSTLVRTLTGALHPTGGEVRFSGARRSVGLAPQQIALYPWLNPRENSFAFGRLSGLPRGLCRTRLERAMRLTGCEPVARVPLAKLSGGYQRRANIAAALMDEPELLVLDEPTAGLDAEGRAHVGATVAALRAAGAAVLLITHDFDFAEEVADRVAILANGAIACSGPPRELIAARLGGAARIDFTLKAEPDTDGRARLAALGAEPISARAFRLRRPLDALDVRALSAELAAAGLAASEWRVRPAGLEDLFADAVGAERAA